MKCSLWIGLLLLGSPGCVTPTMWGWSGREATHPAEAVSEVAVGDERIDVTVRYACGVEETVRLPGNPIVLVVEGRTPLPARVVRAEALVHGSALPRARALKWSAAAPRKLRPPLVGIHADDPSRVYWAVPRHQQDQPTVVDWVPFDPHPFAGGPDWPVFRGCPEHAEGTALARVFLLPCTVIADTVIVATIGAGGITYLALAIAGGALGAR